MLNLRVKQVIYESKIWWQYEKAKAARYSAKDLKNLCILPENSAEGLGCRREHCWSYIVSAFENKTTNLVVEGRVQLEDSSHTSISDVYWRKQLNRQAHLELCHRNPDILERVLNQITLLRTHASYKATRTWRNFNSRGTKVILLSDELRSVANNSKSFASRSKSIIRNNLGLCKHSEIYLI